MQAPTKEEVVHKDIPPKPKGLLSKAEFGGFGWRIKEHWLKYRPKMCRELQRKGKLDQAVFAAQELTLDLLEQLESQKPPLPPGGRRNWRTRSSTSSLTRTTSPA